MPSFTFTIHRRRFLFSLEAEWHPALAKTSNRKESRVLIANCVSAGVCASQNIEKLWKARCRFDMKTVYIVAMCAGGGGLLCILLVITICVLRKRTKTSNTDDDDSAAQSGCALHYIDMSGNERVLDVNALGARDGITLLATIANHCGVQDSSAIALTYVNDARRCVEVDPDLLLRSDGELSDRLMQSKFFPLRLGWRVKPPQPEQKRHQKQRVDEDAKACSAEESRIATRIHECPQEMANGSYKDVVGSTPLPLILPTNSHITSSNPITITAAQYTVEGSNYVLDVNTVVAMQEALRQHTPRSILLEDGSVILVDPARRTVCLRTPQGNQCAVTEHPAGELKYTIDNKGAGQWYPYRCPIYLPPGRWCVRAEASSADHRRVRTTSRVFTVDVVEK
ncbi:uncharacterized protein TEOVI_000526800 [Trypanosoma equiperdum]|uniref:Uncharacterized protein n=2 Tax=Trypanozoon TaxID=39700 RepID=Q38AR3_TRYB2|nr:hypothetical protein, conserved [Trypanosoma brucei brucei TREU927]EAN78107.1 hypothetical protein, conserved [Trypanosoma brucei brucei TREU927]SCU68813.1 hypothetical protein, conserved [Trypanosoma equiperdum]